MQQVVFFLHILICLGLIALVLLQQGKGANMGAAFGSGASNTLFGSRGPASFLMKLTGILVALFFITSLTLGYLAAKAANQANNLPTQPNTVAVQQQTAGVVKQQHKAISLEPGPVIFSKS